MKAGLLFLFLCSLATGEARLELPDPVVPGLEMTATVIINDPPTNIQRVILPDVPGITWGEPRRTGNRTTIINGNATTRIDIGIPFTVAQPGAYEIPPLRLLMRDRTEIPTAASRCEARAADPTLVGEAVADARFEPASIVPGEPTELIYRLRLCSTSLGISDETPDSAFGVKPPAEAILLGKRSVSTSTTVDAKGQTWCVATIRWPLTAAAPGTLRVSGQQSYQTQVEDARSFFGRRSVERQAPIKPAELTVLPLPTIGRPDDFAGLIGPVTVTASLDRLRISTGEGAVLTIAISGRQTDLQRRPILTAPAGSHLYPKDESSDGGIRSFRWDFVPERPGTMTLPAVSVSYFDPRAKGYAHAASTPLTLEVLPGRSRELASVGGSAATSSQPLIAPAASLGTVLPPPLRQAGGNPPGLVATGIAGGIGILLGGGLALALRLRTRGPRTAHRGRALLTAVASRDAQRIASSLEALAQAPLDPAQQTRRTELLAQIDLVRFGGGALPDDLAERCRPLEGVA